MRVVLVSPPTHFEASKPMPSMALGILSGALETAGIETVCIDCNFAPGVTSLSLVGAPPAVEERYLESCLDAILDCRPDSVGISAWGVSLPFALTLAHELNRRAPGLPLLAGGIRDAGLALAMLRQEPALRAVAVGDGEGVVVPIVKRLAGKTNGPLPESVAWRTGRTLVPCRGSATLPAEDWLMPVYDSFMFPPGDHFLFEGSRGCPQSCVFCCLNREPFRRRAPEDVVADIAALHQSQPVVIASLADNFIPLSGEWTERFCRLMASQLPEVGWLASARADGISLATVARMARSGCRGLFIGVESVSPGVLCALGKTRVPESYCRGLIETMTAIAEMGIKTRVSTIVGSPREGLGEMERTIEFVIRLIERGVAAFSGVLMVYPGSRLWSEYEAGRLELVPIGNQRLFRNYGGLFADRYEHMPWFVPNHYMPRHAWIPPEQLESFLDARMSEIERARSSGARR